MTITKTHYHHGNLKPALLAAASEMIITNGVDSLSLRKLAEKVGVSRTAAYHHFADKDDLLASVASHGFEQWLALSNEILADDSLDSQAKFKAFFSRYIDFATTNSAVYELMFGRTLWKSEVEKEKLISVAHPCFQYQVEMMQMWQQQALFPADENPVRLAQVVWATMHGLARLCIDGIYLPSSNIDAMVETAINLLIKK